MRIEILPLSQKDDKWRWKKLGFGTVTIGTAGCKLICCNMLLNYYYPEANYTPDILNELFKSKGVYHNQNLIHDWTVASLFDGLEYDQFLDFPDTPCDMAVIDKYLEDGKPVIVWVFNKGIQHFILIKEKTHDNRYVFNEPLEGDDYYLDVKYGEPKVAICGWRLYSGEVKYEPTTEDQVSDLETKVKSLNEALAKAQLENNELRKDLEAQERDNKDLSMQILEARKERDRTIGEKKDLERKITNLDKQLERLEQDITSLQVENERLRDELSDSQKGRLGKMGRLKALIFFISWFFFGKGGENL